jgi:hypothetical protein
MAPKKRKALTAPKKTAKKFNSRIKFKLTSQLSGIALGDKNMVYLVDFINK